MSAASTSIDARMQDAVAALLAPSGETMVAGSWQRQFGGNARQAFRFDTRSADGRTLPRILLSQVAAKHVESNTVDEYAVLAALNGAGVRAPAAVALDAEGVVTGAPAIVLERLDGDAGAVEFLRGRDLAAGHALTEDLALATADLHRFDWKAAGLIAGADPVMAQIEYWEANFRRHRLEALPAMAWLFGWLRANAPTCSRLSLVHGDLRPGNFLYRRDRVTALLDWEMAHVGDPAEDIAWIYRTLWSPAQFLPLDDFLAIHAERAGFTIRRSNVVFYRIFSEVKFAAISAAAAHTFASGGTRNLRHIDRAAKIPQCVRLAMKWIEANEWSERHAAA